jgi:hypothetical protein
MRGDSAYIIITNNYTAYGLTKAYTLFWVVYIIAHLIKSLKHETNTVGFIENRCWHALLIFITLNPALHTSTIFYGHVHYRVLCCVPLAVCMSNRLVAVWNYLQLIHPMFRSAVIWFHPFLLFTWRYYHTHTHNSLCGCDPEINNASSQRLLLVKWTSRLQHLSITRVYIKMTKYHNVINFNFLFQCKFKITEPADQHPICLSQQHSRRPQIFFTNTQVTLFYYIS